MINDKRRNGLTLIEIVICVALIVILSATYLLVANPAGQLANARNNTRSENLQAIMLAIRQNIADQGNETFLCASGGALPTTTTNMASATGSYNIAPCLVPNYLAVMPTDPSASSAAYVSAASYNTDYSIVQNASGSITLSAPNAEQNQKISITR
jgi:prepilin-type N-terminal cleavage/methylation domain-containing protein